MKNIFKYIKGKYFISYFKFLKYKIFNRKIYFNGYRYYFGRRVDLEILKDSKFILEDKIYISDYCKIECTNGAIKIGYNNFFNRNCNVISMESIEIGNNNLFGPNVSIYDHDHKYEDSELFICKQGFNTSGVTIGSDVWIGANVVITKGVTIGNRVIVGANCVVTKDLESNAIYAGNPAKMIKRI